METRVQSLGREDPLEKEMAIHSSTIAWKIPWTEEPVGYSPWGPKELDTTERLHSLTWYLAEAVAEEGYLVGKVDTRGKKWWFSADVVVCRECRGMCLCCSLVEWLTCKWL